MYKKILSQISKKTNQVSLAEGEKNNNKKENKALEFFLKAKSKEEIQKLERWLLR